MGNQENKEEVAADKAVNKKIGLVIAIASAILGISTAFYSVTARVAVLENRADQIEDNYKASANAAKDYSELAQSINSRLSNIEGFLGATGYKSK